MIKQLAMPHKIFVWDPHGTYVDYSFPNAYHGHFLHHLDDLKGIRVTDLFSKAVGAGLLKKITLAWETGARQTTVLLFERDGQYYEARVTCVSTSEELIHGLVIDRMIGSVPHSLVTPHRKKYCGPIRCATPWATAQQCRVVEGLVAGFTNQQIANHLGLTERTVKSHLSKIYEKLGVANRHGLLVHLAQDGCFPGSSSATPTKKSPDPPVMGGRNGLQETIAT